MIQFRLIMKYSRIHTASSYLPKKKVTNDMLSETLDTSHEWIAKRTGIHSRHILSEDENATTMAIAACEKLFDDTDVQPTQISSVVVACNTSGSVMPSIACQICNYFSINSAFAVDLNAACSGFIYALSVANDRIRLHGDQFTLVVGVDAMSRIVNWKDRQSAVLFGDGAGCVLLKQSDSPGIFAIDCGSESTGASLLSVTGDMHLHDECYLSMQGKEVFKFAVDKLSSCFNALISKYDIPKNTIDWLIPHQANERILDQAAKKIDLPPDIIIKTVKTHANTSAASIPLALKYGLDNDKIKPGNRLVFQAFGAGFTWGIAAIDY